MNTTLICQTIGLHLTERGWRMASAESCTGGMISSRCTDLAGSSAWFDRGFVTYSNAAKEELLGVDHQLIAQHGAVSEEVARAMAQGAAQHANVQVAVAVTGVAGPTGGSDSKPVGTVWFAWCVNHTLESEKMVFTGDRAAVREAATQFALQGVLKRMA
jgi:nicotinamide-nucleotide amidase